MATLNAFSSAAEYARALQQLGYGKPRNPDANKSVFEALEGFTLDIVDRLAKHAHNYKFASPTLIDIAVKNAGEGIQALIDETITAHPELLVLPARSIQGMSYPTLVRVALPTVAFRNANEGTASTKGQYVNRLVETFILNPQWDCDRAVADRDEDGPEAFIKLEAGGILEASMQHLAEIFYYGRVDPAVHLTKGDAKGFNGLHSQVGTVAADNICVDAGGTTGSTGSSVWMVKGGPAGCQWVWGANGELEVSKARLERVEDAGGVNKYTAYFQELLAYPGLQVGSSMCVGRIGELTEDATCTLTDAMLAKLFSQFPTGSKPDHIFMSRRSQRQLRDSRTWAAGGTVVTGGQPVPFEYYWEQIPIHVTDAISDTEEVGLLT